MAQKARKRPPKPPEQVLFGRLNRSITILIAFVMLSLSGTVTILHQWATVRTVWDWVCRPGALPPPPEVAEPPPVSVPQPESASPALALSVSDFNAALRNWNTQQPSQQFEIGCTIEYPSRELGLIGEIDRCILAPTMSTTYRGYDVVIEIAIWPKKYPVHRYSLWIRFDPKTRKFEQQVSPALRWIGRRGDLAPNSPWVSIASLRETN
jgi:hypothetical protein